MADFDRDGWTVFPPEPEVAAWARAALPVAEGLTADPALRAQWLRCGGTWFAGVNVFPNDGAGAMAGVPPLGGAALAMMRARYGDFTLDAAQISVCWPGYPQPWDGEDAAAFGFRKNRDAAHVDGVARIGAGRRRRLSETHGFILGLPLNAAPAAASPLVVWRGSHIVMREALTAGLRDIPRDEWGAADITEAYTAARKACFADCERVAAHAPPGGSYLLHPLALHGVAPWTAPDGPPRSVAYFRPDVFGGDFARWLGA